MNNTLRHSEETRAYLHTLCWISASFSTLIALNNCWLQLFGDSANIKLTARNETL